MSRAAIPAPIRSTPNSLPHEQGLKSAIFTAFGMTRRPGRSVVERSGRRHAARRQGGCDLLRGEIVGLSGARALGTTNDENLASIRDSVSAANAKGREVLVDCEHFFDGYKDNREFALACAKTAYESGARWVVLCDTNGGTMPDEVEEIVGDVVKHIPGANVGIHAHNDTEQAVAVSLAAVRAGARQIQGTLNGLGERCGNANLISMIPTLKLKKEFAETFEIGVPDEKLVDAGPGVARARQHPQPRARSACALCRRQRLRHQDRHPCLGGAEGSADLRARAARKIGNHRKVLVSDQAGRSNVLASLDPQRHRRSTRTIRS